jgi:hypothetical protein
MTPDGMLITKEMLADVLTDDDDGRQVALILVVEKGVSQLKMAGPSLLVV